MKFQHYLEQLPGWPQSGKHIMAQFDHDSIIVYQAYSPEIAEFALKHQYFGGAFSYSRMSWIKPNFLWMMFRSGWASKPGQERVLAIRIKRNFFDELLKHAVASSYDPAAFSTHAAWKQAIETSNVRLQWDPDHDPVGHCMERRAVQLGLRGETLRRYGREAIIDINDVTDFVKQQQPNNDKHTSLLLPAESVYQSY